MSTDKLPQNYDELKEALDKLFEDWEEELKEKFDKKLKEKFEKKLKERLDKELKGRVDKELEGKIAKELEGKIGKKFKFVKDGAFPGYFDQPLKILFVGREAYGCEGLRDPDSEICRKCDPSYPCEGRKFMNFFLADDGALEGQERPLAAQIAAKITYGMIQKPIPDWQEIPDYPAGVSFAFMDVSKYANPGGPKPSGGFSKYVKASLGANESKRNFTREEIDLLDPDLIITWNLSYKPGVDFLEKLTVDPYPERRKLPGNNELKQTRFPPDKLVNVWTYYNSSNGREVPLIDAYHFSDFHKNKTGVAYYYYNPIREAVKKLIEQGKLKVKRG